MNQDSEKKMQELQLLSQHLQNLLLQKQAFQLELDETQNALKEIIDSKEDVYKIIGQLMIKSNKDSVVEDLKSKEKLIESRLNAIERQETSLSEKVEALRNEITKELG